MRVVDVDITRIGSRLRDDFGALERAGRRGVYEAALIGEGIIAAATPVDTAETATRWRTVRTPGGVEVVNDSPVALFLEEGTRPHHPPLLPIVQWLARQERVGIPASLSDADGDLAARAQGIARAIARRGTPAHRMIGSNLPTLSALMRKRVEVALRRGGLR